MKEASLHPSENREARSKKIDSLPFESGIEISIKLPTVIYAGFFQHLIWLQLFGRKNMFEQRH